MNTLDLGNNGTMIRGLSTNSDGTFTAILYTSSKEFKTYNGAVKWLARNGVAADGSRLEK